MLSADEKLNISISNQTENGFFQLLHASPIPSVLIRDYLKFFCDYFLEIGQILESRSASEDVEFVKNRKFLGLLHGKMVKRDEDGNIQDSFTHWFHKKALSLQDEANGNYEELMNKIANDISNDIAVYTTEKSGWSFVEVIEFEIKVTRYRISPNRGSCNIVPKLPKSIARKALVVVDRARKKSFTNIGSNCFIDAISIVCFIRFYEITFKTEFKFPKNANRPSTWTKLIKDTNLELKFHPKLMQSLSVDVNRVYLFENDNPQFFVTIIGSNGKSGFYTLKTYSRERLLQFKNQNDNAVPLFVNLLLFNNHYFPIASITTLLRFNDNHHKYFCPICLHQFNSMETLDIHVAHCNGMSTRKIIMPKEGTTLDFSKYRIFCQHHPVVIYADTETIHLKEQELSSSNISKSRIIDKHVPFMVAYYIAFSKDFRKVLDKACNNAFGYPILLWDEEVIKFEDYPNNLYKSFTGKNCMEQFLESLFETSERLGAFMSRIKIKFCYQSSSYKNQLKTATHCHICMKEFDPFNENFKPVIDHCHWTGNFRGIAHNSCNMVLSQRKRFFPVIFHNFRNYDSHLLCRYAKFSQKADLKIGVIPSTAEKYLSLSLKWVVGQFTAQCVDKDGNDFQKTISLKNELRFLDSFQFLSVKLETLVQQLSTDDFYHTGLNFSNQSIFNLATRKGVYPYTYMDSFEKLNETTLPPKEAFVNDLEGDQIISNDNYAFAKSVWQQIKCETIKDYTEFYLKVDVLTLADVFDCFRTNSYAAHNIDPVFNFSLPGLSWAAMLRNTKVQFDLLHDYEMQCFFEAGIRGGLTQCTKNYSEADNIYTNPDAHSTANDFSKYLFLFDANGLYSWAMSQPLPYGDFKWVNEQSELKSLFLQGPDNFPDIEGERGYVVMCDLQYPDEIHDKTASYPLAPSHESIQITDYSIFMLNQWEKTHPSTFKIIPESKLVSTCADKTNYVVHFRTLQFYLKMGLQITKITQAVSFKQAAFMKPYIDCNIDERKKWSHDKAKSDFYKKLNNAVFGKTMQSQRKHKHLKLSSNETEQLNFVGKNTFQGSTVISNDLVIFNMLKEKLELNKPIYVGQAILDISKLLMFQFYYNVMQPRFKEISVLYTDTDSLLLEICDENVERKLLEIKNDWIDGSNMPTDNALYNTHNKGSLGFFKDEMNGIPLEKAVLLRPKMYCLKAVDQSEKIRAKGIKDQFVKRNFAFDQYFKAYIESLENKTKNMRNSVKFKTFQSQRHEIFTIEQEKCGLLLFDNKRYWTSINNSLPFFHYKANISHGSERQDRQDILLKKHNVDTNGPPILRKERPTTARFRDEYTEQHITKSAVKRKSEALGACNDHISSSSSSASDNDEVEKTLDFIDDSNADFIPCSSKKPRFNQYFDSESKV